MRSKENRWLHRFAVLTAAATLLLICAGGVVTSKGVGLSVPDWPTTYGYNMFFFPVSQWVGGVFYEHSHRLIASGVGLLTTILAAWLWLRDSRRWLRWLGVLALLAVVVQGVLGGLRVTELADELGIVHATLAQLFFVLTCAIALFTSRWWLKKSPSAQPLPSGKPLQPVFLTLSAIIFVQLVIGATMRHQHAGLAIPDFPLAYGQWWPQTTPAAVDRYNQLRHEAVALNPITSWGVLLQMAHRIMALAIAAGVLTALVAARLRLGRRHLIVRMCWTWMSLILAQVALGAFTIWTNKSADIATTHVAVGALSLVNGVMLCLLAWRLGERTVLAAPAPAPVSGHVPDRSEVPA